MGNGYVPRVAGGGGSGHDDPVSRFADLVRGRTVSTARVSGPPILQVDRRDAELLTAELLTGDQEFRSISKFF